MVRDRPKLNHVAYELMEILGNVRIPRIASQESVMWAPTQVGTFSVKTSYNLLSKEENNLGDWSTVWIPQLTPKINFFW